MAEGKTDRQPPRKSRLVFARFLLIWLPLAAVLAGIVGTLHQAQTRATHTIFSAADRQAIDLARNAADTSLASVRSDLLYLADLTMPLALNAPEPRAGQTQLATNYLAFAARKQIYDQIRYLDEAGREIVRVDWNNGHPAIVPETALQDKSGRYYVRETLAQERGGIYVSPLDLNIEHGAIEQPLKPTIRFGTPIFDRDGNRRGIVVLNYRAQQLIDRVKAIAARTESAIWLINSDGYWLIGPRAEDEWGFMYPGSAQARFDRQYPEAWAAIRSGGALAQFTNDRGLFTYRRFSPDPSQSWIFVRHTPLASVAAQTSDLIRNLSAASLALMLLLTAAAWAIAHYSVQRRLAQASIRASESRFRGLLESAPDAIVSTDRDGVIVLVNAQAEKYFGYTRDELVGQPVELLVPDSVRGRHGEYRTTYQAHPHQRPMGAGLDLHARRRDGSEFPVEISLSPLETDEGMLITATIRDITARKQADRQRFEAQERYRELVNNLPVGVYRNTAEPAWRFLEANPAMAAMFEADAKDALLGNSSHALFRNPAEQQAFNEKIMQHGFATREELELQTLKGRPFWGSVTAVLKRNTDGSVYLDGIVEDITDRKQTEQQLLALSSSLRNRTTELEAINKELEAFSYSVSHDLRAPLRSIDGFSRILIDSYADRLDDTGRDRLERVRRAAQHMGTLIDDLLKLSRVTRAELTREAVDLSALAAEVFDELCRQKPERPVQLTVQPGLVAQGDRRLLRVVFDNLLGNAWKFTGERADAHVEVGTIMHHGIPALFVRDNGAGFDMAYAGKLFGAFQRLHDTREFPGTGIGLATVQRVIHKHGGQIWAEAAVGQGATFYFTLQPEEGLS